MKRFIYQSLCLMVCLCAPYLSKACNSSLITIANQVDNGDGTTTYTLNLTTELGGLDVPFYGFALSFNSPYNTPSVVPGSFDPSLTSADLTSGSLSGPLTGLIGTNVNSVALDSDFNKYDNLTNVITYESFSTAASNDFAFTLTVTVSGCVESIVYDGSVNAGSSSCMKTAVTGQNCQCLLDLAPTSTDTICHEVGGLVTLLGNASGTEGTNPAYAWSSSDAGINGLLDSTNTENTTLTLPVNYPLGTYTINLTYTDDNTCSLSEDVQFVIVPDGVGTCSPLCDFSTLESVAITPNGDHNMSAGFTQIYVLTTEDSTILATSTNGDFGTQTAGTYLIMGLNYEDADAPTPLPAVGVNINNMTGGCFDLSNRLQIGVCEPCTDPAEQPTNIVLSNETSSSFDIAWTNSSSTEVIVVIRDQDSTANDPVPGNSYNGNTTFGSGDNLGNGNFVLYSGTTVNASPLTVTGLLISTEYVVSIYAVNDTCILLSDPLIDTTTTSDCAEPSTLPTNITIPDLTGTSVDLSWTNGNGDQVLVVIREAATPHIDPVSGTSYTGSTVFAGDDSTGVGNYVAYSGGTATSSITITGLSLNTTYDVSVYTFNSVGTCYNVLELDTSFTTPFDVNIINDTLYACGGTLYDDGGQAGNYVNGPNIVTVLMPDVTGEGVCLDFTTWNLDYNILGYSELSFFDGTNTSAPLIMTATGDWVVDESGTTFDFNGPGMVCAKGPMTLEWNPDDVAPGWEASVTCYQIPADTPTCNISVNSNATICPGESFDLMALGEIVSLPINNNFNDSTLGLGWTTSVDARFDNPCGAGPDSSHLWMGIESSPRVLSSGVYDVTQGGTISFDFKMATQGVGAPCEGPDEVQEGVYLQYSTDGGTSWTTIHYFFPSFYTDGSAHTLDWENYVFNIPPAALTSTTEFRWIQNDISSSSTDHWGIDNVIISVYQNNTSIVWDNGLGSGANKTVSPTANTTYTATISDGISSCQASVTVTMCSPLSVNSNSFNGNCNGNKVELEWNGISQIDEKDFVIERSNEDFSFYEIGTVPMANGESLTNYSYLDYDATSQQHYYRIKVRKTGGKVSYSDIIGPFGNCELVQNGVFDSWFDYESRELVLSYKVDKETNIALTYYDVSGRLIDVRRMTLTPANNKTRVRFDNNLPPAMYLFNVVGISNKYTGKFFVNPKR